MTDNNNNNNFDSTSPIGIDFDNFNNLNITINPVNESNDLPIITELTKQHKVIKDILLKRKMALKTLSSSWVKGDLDESIKFVVDHPKDLGLAKDFFNYAFMTKEVNKDYLKLDHCVQMVPLILGLVKSKYEPYFRVGIKMVCMIFDMYSNTIAIVRRSAKVGANTEETYLKYDALIRFFDDVTKCDTIKTRDLEKDLNLKSLLQDMNELVSKWQKGY